MKPVILKRKVYRTSYRYKPRIVNFGRAYSVTLRDGITRNIIAGVSGSSWQDESYFSESNWESNYTEILRRQEDKAGNSGQESILSGDFFDAGQEYCRSAGQGYQAEDFVNFVADALGESKYNAISEIISECSEEMYEALDYSIGGDSVGPKAFGLLSKPRIFRGLF